MKDYLVQASHFTCQTNGARKVHPLPQLASKGWKLPHQASSSWSAAFPPGRERGLVGTVSDPVITIHSLLSLPGRQRHWTLCSHGTWLSPHVAKMSVKGLRGLEDCTFPRSPSARVLQHGHLVDPRMGGRRASLGHCCEIDKMSLALPAAFLYTDLFLGASVGGGQQSCEERRALLCSLAQQDPQASSLEMQSLSLLRAPTE